ncbi:uncharacterized protein LOC118347673 [Juglans regia]|uniref:Uncharacterized protein LOC118347673 n=1 Tax=Juglans regia TaxID=51240 RepID=A0A6P9E8E1_JUGRE|nr:uncharacterized protein LOC118347673 [Juglans regia]
MDDFNQWIHEGGLIDLSAQGSNFSWCNGQSGLARAWAKLDRVLLDANLLSLFPTASCSYLPMTTSDHCPMLVEFLKDPYSYGPPPFRFQQMWVEHPEFIDFVKQVWSVPVVGTGLVILACKLKKVKVALREWNKRVFGRTNAHIESLEAKVEGLEGCLQREWDIEAKRELVVALDELCSWRRREDIRLAQMTKIKWNMDGDRNSKCFHSRVLPELSDLISPVIDVEDCTCLGRIPSLDEVKEALSSIPINSSPRPDGFGAGSPINY